MKKNLTSKLVMVVLCLLLTTISTAQCPPNNIKTWPDSATNPINPALTNLNFNWASTGYPIALSNNTNTNIFAPWFQPSNSNILHFQDLPLDNSFKDGWELIKYETGYDLAGNPLLQKPTEVYVIMYNKYQGILRIFAGLGALIAQNNSARFSLKFVNNDETLPNKSSLLDFSAGLIPLDVPFAPKDFWSAANFINSPLRWFYAEFPMQYDPCTCIYKSRILLEVRLINTMQVNMQTNGSANGILGAVTNGSGTINQTSDSKSWLNQAEKATGKFTKVFKTMDALRVNQQSQVSLTHSLQTGLGAIKSQSLVSLTTSSKSKSFLGNLGKWGEVAGAALSLADFFISGGKKQETVQDVRLSPTQIDMSIDLTTTGTITSSFQYAGIGFQTPGAPQGSTPNSNMPLYGEVLGVLNMLETPEVERYVSTEFLPDNTINTNADFRFTKPLKYVLNPASRLAIREVKAALVLEGTVFGNTVYGYSTEPDTTLYNNQEWIYESRTNTNVNPNVQHWRSNIQDATCLNKWVYRSTHNRPINRGATPQTGMFVSATGQAITPYVKLYVRLRRTQDTLNAQDVLMVLKYPCKVISKQNPLTQPGEFVNDVTAPCNFNTFVQATTTEVSNYCNTNVYKNNRIFRTSGNGNNADGTPQNTNFIALQKSIKISPNPASDFINLSVTAPTTMTLRVALTNEAGVVMLINNYRNLYGTNVLPINVKNYAAGNYVLEISDGKNSVSRKVIIIK